MLVLEFFLSKTSNKKPFLSLYLRYKIEFNRVESKKKLNVEN